MEPQVELTIAALNTDFDTKCLAVAAGEEFTLTFDNQDQLNHNFAILPDGKAEPLLDTGIFVGPAARSLEGRLPSGDYLFHCIVHPNMVGTITAN
ncbi:MAG: cupredoxin domain-containing protein [Acidimicrobiales bacterium]